MIEINRTRPGKDEKGKVKSKKRTSSTVSHSEETFAGELHKSIIHEFHGTVDELLNNLNEQEKKFLQYQNEFELARYKAMIQKILKMILDENASEKTLKRTRRDRTDYTIVDKINSQLIALTRAITTSNRAFNVLKTIEEIRGLILDLRY